MLVLTFITGLLSAIIAPRFGHWSDRYGRTRLMAISSAGGLAAELITILAAKFPETVDYRWLVLGSVCDGMLGSFTAGGLLTQSYATDCTPPSKRAVRFGYLHSCLFLGLAFGPLLAGYFVKLTGSLISMFYVAMGCHVVFILVIGFVTPESLSKRRRQAAKERYRKEKLMRKEATGVWLSRIQSVNLFEPLRILWPMEPGTNFRIRLNLLALALADMIILGASIAAGPVMILYSEYMFGWGNFEASVFVSTLSLIRVALLLGIFPVINYFARVRPARRRRAMGIDTPDKNSGADTLDVWIIRIAFVGEVVGCTGYILARHEAVFFASGMMMALGGVGSATMQATMTKLIPADKVGQFLGATGMLHALARIIGPVMFNGIYAATVGTFPQAFFVVLLSFFSFALIMSFCVKKNSKFLLPI
jgi:MFS family permease